MVAPQAGQKREDGSTCLPHFEQNMWISERFYFAIGRFWRKSNLQPQVLRLRDSRSPVSHFAQDDMVGVGGVRVEASVVAFGMTRQQQGNSRFLHCAPHDEAVRRFDRNDDSWVGKRKTDKDRSKGKCNF